MRDLIRRVVFSPYRKGAGPKFTLSMYDIGSMGGYVSYSLRQSGEKSALFSGEDFRPSPLHSMDGNDSVRALMTFLCLRPGDTDNEFFDDYTPAQFAFCDSHAEELGAEVERRFPECPIRVSKEHK